MYAVDVNQNVILLYVRLTPSKIYYVLHYGFIYVQSLL